MLIKGTLYHLALIVVNRHLALEYGLFGVWLQQIIGIIGQRMDFGALYSPALMVLLSLLLGRMVLLYSPVAGLLSLLLSREVYLR